MGTVQQLLRYIRAVGPFHCSTPPRSSNRSDGFYLATPMIDDRCFGRVSFTPNVPDHPSYRRVSKSLLSLPLSPRTRDSITRMVVRTCSQTSHLESHEPKPYICTIDGLASLFPWTLSTTFRSCYLNLRAPFSSDSTLSFSRRRAIFHRVTLGVSHWNGGAIR
jgi:hypothetical protein